MVLKKRLDYGFNGYPIPVAPRAPRSIRRRGPRKMVVEDHQICAFELLAAVAGKLLLENESSASSNASEFKDLLDIHTKCVKEERVEENKLAANDHNNNKPFFGSIAKNDSLLEHISNNTRSESSKKVECELKLGVCNSKTVEGNLDTDVVVSFQPEDHINQIKYLTVANPCGVKKQVDKCMNIEQLINPDSNVQLSLYSDPLPNVSFPKHRNDVNLVIRDDDENSFKCNKFSTKIRAFRQQPRSSYGRIRKMLTSKYWKVAPKFRDQDLSNTDEGMKTFYHSRKRTNLQDRYLKEAPFKKRILYDRSSESICESPEKRIKGEKISSNAFLHRGNGVSTSFKVHKRQKDSKVKLSIKSFKVPEFYIEVPETETIGALKRTVMETVTAILGGGLRVGLVLQGKKVRDDNRTLQQAGIYSSNLDTLGFILEPNFTPKAETSKDSAYLFNTPDEKKLQRSPTNTPNARFHLPLVSAEMDNSYETNLEIVPSSVARVDEFTDEAKQDSKALVPITMVPMAMNHKKKRSEISHRRTRRPFSVAEVEALVKAVETLGTGRWRDVKMRAFNIAGHRTYVDLKDKWKTLVHTASISSQQRRGEPVPQELLDRVLSAHAHWSQNQCKPHVKDNDETVEAIDAQGKAVEV